MNSLMIAKGFDRTLAMLAGVALYLMLLQSGCIRPLLPGDRLDEDAPIEKLSHKPPPQFKFKQGRG